MVVRYTSYRPKNVSWKFQKNRFEFENYRILEVHYGNLPYPYHGYSSALHFLLSKERLQKISEKSIRIWKLPYIRGPLP